MLAKVTLVPMAVSFAPQWLCFLARLALHLGTKWSERKLKWRTEWQE